MQKLGTHVSAAGGISNAPVNAKEEGCETFQFFMHPPQQYKFPALPDNEVSAFLKNCKKFGFTDYFVHASYLINLASPNNRIRYGAINLLKKALIEGSKVKVSGVMFHAGTATGQPNRPAAIRKAIESINKILDGYTGHTKLLIENAAGAGATLGRSFKEVGRMMRGVKNQAKISVCMDTQHSFASGYDWTTTAGTNKALAELSKEVGMRKLAVIHANDSKADCGSNKDRHEHIGKGKIGKEGFARLLHHPKLQNKPFILETPRDGRKADLKALRTIQKAK
ncbi:MAG: deoxyribonuclease IV [Candidatus Kerfeldbacteria bacterium]